MRNVTLSAEEHLIESARARARRENTTLNEAFRAWLAQYAQHEDRMRRFDETVNELSGMMRAGRKFTREEMNER